MTFSLLVASFIVILTVQCETKVMMCFVFSSYFVGFACYQLFCTVNDDFCLNLEAQNRF